MLSSSKVSFEGAFWRVRPLPGGAPNLVQTMAHQFKSIILGVHFWGVPPRKTLKFGPNNCLTNNFLRVHCEFQLSMLSSSKVSWGGGGGHFGEFPPEEFPNLVQTFASQTISYILAVQKFHFGVQKFQLPLPRKTPKFGPNNCLTNNFLHSKFRFTMLSSSKVSFRRGHFLWEVCPFPWRTPNWSK